MAGQLRPEWKPLFRSASGGDPNKAYRMPVFERGWKEERVTTARGAQWRVYTRWQRGKKHTLVVPELQAQRMDRIKEQIIDADCVEAVGDGMTAYLLRRDLDIDHHDPPLSPVRLAQLKRIRDEEDNAKRRAVERRRRRAWRWTVRDSEHPELNTPGEIYGDKSWKELMEAGEKEGENL